MVGRPKGSISKNKPPPRQKTRRLKAPSAVISKTGIEVQTCYCRKCMQNKKPSEFYTATDTYLDSNGYMSICKACIESIFMKAYQAETSLEKAYLKVCRMLNIVYSERVLQQAIVDAVKEQEQGKLVINYFSLYKTKLLMMLRGLNRRSSAVADLTFVEPNIRIQETTPDMSEDKMDMMEYLEKFWGKGMSMEDYQYLEQEFGEWRRTTKCDTQSEIILVKEICYKQNEIRKARIMGNNVDASVKALQEIMKNSALTPALQNAASSGKNQDTYGVWLRDIESTTPAEWYQDKGLFKDIDKIQYFGDYIIRSIKNFITGSRDFSTTDLTEISELDDPEIEGDL